MTDTALDPTLGAALRPTSQIDADHPAVRAFAHEHGRGRDER